MNNAEFEQRFDALIARAEEHVEMLARERNEAIVLMLEASRYTSGDLWERIVNWHTAFCFAHPDWRPPE